MGRRGKEWEGQEGLGGWEGLENILSVDYMREGINQLSRDVAWESHYRTVVRAMCHENRVIGLMSVRCAMGIGSLDR